MGLVAIKELRLADSSDIEDTLRSFSEFRSEVHIMQLLSHPNVIRLLGVCLQPRLALVLELAGGPTLRQAICTGASGFLVASKLRGECGQQLSELQALLQHGGAEVRVLDNSSDSDTLRVAVGGREFVVPADSVVDVKAPTPAAALPWHYRLKLALDVALAMRYLQTRSPPIVHRDLRSPNVFLSALDASSAGDLSAVHARVADFGLARMLHSTTMVGHLLTWPWLAPEILDLDCNCYDERSDVYSYGMVLFEIATRKLPFIDDYWERFLRASGFDKHACISEIVYDGLRPPLPDDVPANFAALIRHCWASEASHRPNFNDIVRLLQDMIAGPSLAHHVDAAGLSPAVRPSSTATSCKVKLTAVQSLTTTTTGWTPISSISVHQRTIVCGHHCGKLAIYRFHQPDTNDDTDNNDGNARHSDDSGQPSLELVFSCTLSSHIPITAIGQADHLIVAGTPTGELFVVMDVRGHTAVFRPRRTLHSSAVTSVAAVNGAVFTSDESGLLVCWNAATFEPLAVRGNARSGLHCCCLVNSALWLGTDRGEALVVEADAQQMLVEKKTVLSLPGSQDPVVAMVRSVECRYVWIATQSRLSIWTEDGLLREFVHYPFVDSLTALAAYDAFVFSCDTAKRMCCWDASRACLIGVFTNEWPLLHQEQPAVIAAVHSALLCGASAGISRLVFSAESPLAR